MSILVCIKLLNTNNTSKQNNEKKQALFQEINEKNIAKINKYSIYGTHLNLEGSADILKISEIKINYVDLVLKNIDGKEIRN